MWSVSTYSSLLLSLRKFCCFLDTVLTISWQINSWSLYIFIITVKGIFFQLCFLAGLCWFIYTHEISMHICIYVCIYTHVYMSYMICMGVCTYTLTTLPKIHISSKSFSFDLFIFSKYFLCNDNFVSPFPIFILNLFFSF